MKRLMTLPGVLTFIALLAVPYPDAARAGETTWIDLPVSTGGSVKALLGIPDGASKAPGVVYSHGTFVRRLGYEAAKAKGYDIAEYVAALNAAGYVALAPVRDQGALPDPFNVRPGAVGKESTPGIQAGIEQGIAALRAAVAFLRDHPTASGKVGAVGFSEGGLVTIWSLLDGLAADAAVLMSPATIKKARRLNMRNALRSGGFGAIKAPVLVTLGKDDNAPILRVVKGRLIPAMRDAGLSVEAKPDYPGDHGWFWRVRPRHFADMRAFLDKYLK